MQHLDEGTIHSWLDGALTADEAARVEAHVKECPQCAAAVAEARGFIAAASRILTALDIAPRGVIPVTAPKKRDRMTAWVSGFRPADPLVWRIAATLLVVAGGTLVVMRDRGSKHEARSRSIVDSSVMSRPTSATTEASTAMEPMSTAGEQAAAKTPVNKAPTTDFARKGATGNAVQSERVAYQQLRKGGTVDRGKAAVAEGVTAAAAPSRAPALAPPALARGVVMDAAAEPEPLKVVGTPRRIGANITLYEVAPGDTVTLTESVSVQLQGVVTGAASAAVSPQAARKLAAQSPARTDASTPAVADNQRAASVPSSAGAVSAPAPAPAFETATSVNMISWNDPVTGATLTLSGRMSKARLQEIKIRIERERAASAAKKNP
ncbi:MAG TPA: zf-HC2 domain-containing protein [Gemmatimonadaceae bacterium]|jgi:hypothetical protein